MKIVHPLCKALIVQCLYVWMYNNYLDGFLFIHFFYILCRLCIFILGDTIELRLVKWGMLFVSWFFHFICKYETFQSFLVKLNTLLSRMMLHPSKDFLRSSLEFGKVMKNTQLSVKAKGALSRRLPEPRKRPPLLKRRWDPLSTPGGGGGGGGLKGYNALPVTCLGGSCLGGSQSVGRGAYHEGGIHPVWFFFTPSAPLSDAFRWAFWTNCGQIFLISRLHIYTRVFLANISF